MKEWREKVINEMILRGRGRRDLSESMSFHLSVQLRISLRDAWVIIDARLKSIEELTTASAFQEANYRLELAKDQLKGTQELKRQAIINANSYAQFLGLSEEQYTAQISPAFPDFPGIGLSIAHSPYSWRRLLSEGTRVSWKDQASLSGIEIAPDAETLLSTPRGTEFRIPSKPFTSWAGVMEWRDIVEGPDKVNLGTNSRWATVLENIAFSKAYPDVLAQVGGQLAIGGYSKNNLTPYLDGRKSPMTLNVYDSTSPNEVYPALTATKSVRF